MHATDGVEVMGKRKGNIEIGQRMAEELIRLFGGPAEINRRFGCTKKQYYHWTDGITPGGHMLAKLHHCGGDVIYVLSGRRTNNEKL